MYNDTNLYEKISIKKNICIDDRKKKYWEKLIGKQGIDYVLCHWPHIFAPEEEYVNGKIADEIYLKYKQYYFKEKIYIHEKIKIDYENKNLGTFFVDVLTLVYNGISESARNRTFEISDLVYFDYLESIYSKLMLIAARSLIMEMNFWKETIDNTKEADKLYEEYSRDILSQREYKIAFYEKYPAVFRQVMETVIMGINNFNEFICHFVTDKEKIEQNLCKGNKFKKIMRIESSLSDTHCGGKSVIKVDLDNQVTIIYKPRSVQNEIAYQEIVTWIGKKCGIAMGGYQCIDGNDHGWAGYVFSKDCTCMEEIERYYRRLGVHLFACYVLNVSDIHAENLIANGEYPIIIDMETMLSHNLYSYDSADEKIYGDIHQSVLHSGILPFYIWSQNKQSGLDLSAISGNLGQTYPIKIPVIINPKRIDMGIDYRNAVSNEYRNLAKINGKFLSPNDFVEMIIDGFASAYCVLLQNRAEFIRMLKNLGKIKVRYVFRNSQQYSMLLVASFHPELTIDEAKRHIFFYSLCDMGNEQRTNVIEAEVKDLMKGDFPYFYFEAGNRGLYSSENKSILYFDETSLETVKKKISSLNSSDLEKQRMYIEIALGMLGFSNLKRESQIVFGTMIKRKSLFKKEEVMEMVVSYGKKLLDYAAFSTNKSGVNWIGIKIYEGARKDWYLRPLNMYLYDGKVGIALFFHVLTQLDGYSKFGYICTILDENFFEYTDNKLKLSREEKVDTGAFFGEGSILYYYEFCYKMHGRSQYLEYSRKQVEILRKYYKSDDKYDLLTGNAGALIVILHLYELTNQLEYLELAIELGDFLIKHSCSIGNGIAWKSDINPYPLAGISHGGSGFALAFASLYSKTHNKFYLEVVKKILIYENSLYSERDRNWRDLRENRLEENISGKDIMAWCHGAAGILLARTKLYELLKNTEIESTIRRDMKRGLSKLLEMKIIRGNCLCHGNFGNLYILEEYCRRIEDEEAKLFVNDMFEKLVNLLQDEKTAFFNPCEKFNPGFMIGATGIYYAVLKHCINEISIPSVLLLEI